MIDGFPIWIRVETPLVLQLIGLTFAVLIDPYMYRKHRKLFLLIIGLTFSLIVQNWLDEYYSEDAAYNFQRTLVSIYGYVVRPTLVVLMVRLLDLGKKLWPMWVVVGANAALYMTALFSGITFQFGADGAFERGPLGFACHLISFTLLVIATFWAVRGYLYIRKWEAVIPIAISVMIIGGAIVDQFAGGDDFVSFLTITLVSGCVFYYIWLHLQFVRDHEKALLAEQRIRIMISQIQPHFLFNTLSTIQALCKIDPDKAFTTTEQFGTYLRQNIETLGQSELIPFEKELEHTKTYAEIEMTRFPSIEIEYDTEDVDFLLPALTLQPMVENAIRHGVRIRKHGQVQVTSAKEQDHHVITIKDNGKGFDTTAIKAMSDDHIGIRNVKERIEKMCGGTLDIESMEGEGTTVTIRIPAAEGKR